VLSQASRQHEQSAHIADQCAAVPTNVAFEANDDEYHSHQYSGRPGQVLSNPTQPDARCVVKRHVSAMPGAAH